MTAIASSINVPAGFDVVAIPAFRDNYIWLLRRGDCAVVVDPAMPPGRGRARAGRAAAGRDPDHASPRRPSGWYQRPDGTRRGHPVAVLDRLPSLSQASRTPGRRRTGAHSRDRCRIHGAFRSRPYDRPSGAFQRSATFLRRYPVWRRLRSPVRGHAGTDVRVAGSDRGVAGRYRGPLPHEPR